ncbi:hypothetical protein T4C_3731 [Trichinella pseudospiralis]|uniref:Uncharacterized protein n=1 Tax=Trichinella pseudospiralis TaxID=6337 RepID=A0A0V1K583_TRIPS|nr:hypothetical protein T4C_3731 [Trichinella pseudospiralis]
MVEHINLHIITYEEFVGKRPLKMQVVFLIDVANDVRRMNNGVFSAMTDEELIVVLMLI